MLIRKFKKDDSGAVTVDWVVMTAAVVGIGIATTAAVSTGLDDVAGDTSGVMEGNIISTSFDAAYDFLSDYSPFAPFHDSTWVESTYGGWSELSDEQLMAQYNTHYAEATSGSGSIATPDYLAVQEQIMNDRGLTIPDGNLSSDEVITAYFPIT